MILEQMLAMAVGLVDTVMVSSMGEAAVSGVSLVDMINQLMINMFAALATGGAVVAAQYIGHREEKRACESANQLMVVAVLVSFVLAVFCLVLNRGMLGLFFGSIEPEVMDSAVTYFAISALSFPFLAVYNGGAALFRAMGNSGISLKISLLMNVLNTGFNALFIFGMDMGVAGAALGSLVARAFAAVVICWMLRNPEFTVHFVKFEGRLINPGMARKILYIGIPNGLENSMFQLGKIMVISIISGFGTAQIAANAVGNNLAGIGTIPGAAMGLAMITVVGQSVGAGDYKQAEQYTRKLIKISYAAMAILNGVILLALPYILKIYNLSPDTISLAWALVMIHNGCAMLFWTPSFVLPNALRASGDVKFTMAVSIFSMWVFRIMASLILGKWMGLGAIGVWLAMILDWLFRDALFIGRFKSRKWQLKKVI